MLECEFLIAGIVQRVFHWHLAHTAFVDGRNTKRSSEAVDAADGRKKAKTNPSKSVDAAAERSIIPKIDSDERSERINHNEANIRIFNLYFLTAPV